MKGIRAPMADLDSRDAAPQRIVVALDAALHNHLTLEVAAALAARKRLELVGLFIEDVNLLHLAALPFAREVDRSSALERTLDANQIRLSFRSQARQVNEALNRVAQELRIACSFEVRRGQFLRSALAGAAAADVLFLSRRQRSDRRRRKQGAALPVWVVYDGSPGAQRALLMGGELREPGLRNLAVLLPAAGARELQQRARGLLGATAGDVRFRVLPRFDADPITQTVSLLGGSAVVLHRDSLEHSEETTQALLEALDCPLVVVH